MTGSTAPLSGVRVLDLTNVLAGPFCCHQLAHFGADVIKVEARRTGDLARQLGLDAELNENLMGVSFLAQNAGKRSFTIDLKMDRGKEVFRRLVETADVLVENFRPGVMARLGLGYDELVKHNDRLIYCAISGFGQSGPLRRHPAYDQIVQGMSGVMTITGGPDTAPYRVGYPIADTVGGITAAFAVSAALAKKPQERGCFIDVSMLDSVLATMGWAISNYLIAGQPPRPLGNDNVTSSPSGTFQTKDGLINIAANKQEQFELLCRVIDRPDLPARPEFATRHYRMKNRACLTEELELSLMKESASYWSEALTAAGVPAGPILSVPEVLDHPQVAARELVGYFKSPPGVGRDICLLRTGARIDDAALSVAAPPPRLGEHTHDVLAELGYDANEIAALGNEGII